MATANDRVDRLYRLLRNLPESELYAVERFLDLMALAKGEPSTIPLKFGGYVNSLKRALENGCESVAFPLIATGRNGYPKKEALDVARAAIGEFLDVLESGDGPGGPERGDGHGGPDGPDRHGNHLDVYLTVFDKEAFTVSEQLMGELQSYIDDHYVADHEGVRRRRTFPFEEEEAWRLPERLVSYSKTNDQTAALEDRVPTLDDLLDNLDEPFSDTLLRLIDAQGMTDVEVYKRANIDHRAVSHRRRAIRHL